jgi:hypothetical protein
MVDWGGNYPPGAKNDPRAPYNQPDRSHEHRWWHDEEHINPVIEDGAAIFQEECLYAEGRYGDGWQCEETRTYRFEYDCVEVLGGGEIQLPSITDWENVNDELSEVVVAIEEAWHNGDSRAELSSIDPDPSGGEVAIGFLGYTLYFRPE